MKKLLLSSLIALAASQAFAHGHQVVFMQKSQPLKLL